MNQAGRQTVVGVLLLVALAAVPTVPRAFRPAASASTPTLAEGLPGVGPVRAPAVAAQLQTGDPTALAQLPPAARAAALAWFRWPQHAGHSESARPMRSYSHVDRDEHRTHRAAGAPAGP